MMRRALLIAVAAAFNVVLPLQDGRTAPIVARVRAPGASLLAAQLHAAPPAPQPRPSAAPALVVLALAISGLASRTVAAAAVGGQTAAAAPVAAPAKFDGLAYAQTLPGVMEPLGFFDPLGFCSKDGVTEGKIRFYREVELKHGRVSMLAALGFLVAENFHPLFGGKVDVPSYIAFQETPLQTFWGSVVLAIAVPEMFSAFTFRKPFSLRSPVDEGAQELSLRNPIILEGGETWAIRKDHEAGDFNFDPLDLKPTNPAELEAMKETELTNGRLAMIGIAGMVAQELATGNKLFA